MKPSTFFQQLEDIAGCMMDEELLGIDWDMEKIYRAVNAAQAIGSDCEGYNTPQDDRYWQNVYNSLELEYETE